MLCKNRKINNSDSWSIKDGFNWIRNRKNKSKSNQLHKMDPNPNLLSKKSNKKCNK